MENHPTPPPGEESPMQKQARIRRERREAKIKAGGSARLDKITSLSGRAAETVSNPVDPHSINSSADPDEVNISSQPYLTARSAPRVPIDAPSEADIHRLLRSAGSPGVSPNFPLERTLHQPGQQQQQQQEQPHGGHDGGDDAMMKRILQQLMGGGMPLGGGGGGGGEMGDLPPGLAAMLGGGEGGIDGRRGEQVQGRKGDGYAYVWKIVHALVALALGVYLTCVTAFSGARFSRGADGVQGVGGNGDGGAGVRFFFFWAFATAELGLQSTRFFLERGKVEPGGWMGTIMAVLPQPWKGWLSLVARYSGIFNTVVEDAMVVVFVLGCVAWWGGAVG